MDELAFWKQKIIQFFHDPPGKPFAFYPGIGGHKNIASRLFKVFQGEQLGWVRLNPDFAASGADRPIFPKALKGTLYWPTHPLLTHPLAEEGAVLDPRPVELGDDTLSEQSIRARFIHKPWDLFDRPDDEADEEQEKVVLEKLSNWQDAEDLKRQSCLLWRRFRAALMAEDEAFALVWGEMPSESRMPDHSIWDHLRWTTALAFLSTGNSQKLQQNPDFPRTPWLLRLALTPVQAFIREARTTRDLWVGSFLLSDLAWHAMQPVIEQYGPDAIIYPDLRGNPLADHFLIRNKVFGLGKAELLHGLEEDAASFAALLPASLVAVVPRGGEGDLPSLDALAQKCVAAVEQRWNELASLVYRWLDANIEADKNIGWSDSWERQHQHPPVRLKWSAIPWLRTPDGTALTVAQGHALPAQTGVPELTPRQKQAKEKREQRFRPWLPDEVWTHYDLARDVYIRSNANWLKLERGFDYALTHHQLLQRHELLKQQPDEAMLGKAEEAGEKCTGCGRRQALYHSGGDGSIDGQRKRAREFWQQKTLDPDELGNERLCGICAFKRFLVPAGVSAIGVKSAELTGINPNWAGLDKSVRDVSGDAEVRVPFPSAATLAAQKFIEAVLQNNKLARDIQQVVDAHEAAGLNATTFPRALPRLAALESRLAKREPAWRFLIREAQETLFPEAVLGMSRSPSIAANKARQKKLEELAAAIERLRNNARKAGIAPPETRLAVVKIDGDRMGRLFLGSQDAIGAKWGDVLHPLFVDRLKQYENEAEDITGWTDLLNHKRLMGPSLHAFVNRALAEFQHRIVPWVVEREFSGRLIYSGGDDVLCLVPADEALALASRLQKLFSAPWIVDRQPEAQPWGWRYQDASFSYDQDKARERFSALKPGTAQQPLRAPYTDQMEPAIGEGGKQYPLADVPEKHRIIPMLGKGQSLSAGIAFGHFKMPLGQMLRESSTLLDDWAKEKAGRSAVALSHSTRGGTKNRFAMRWEDHGKDHGEDYALRHIMRVVAAFKDGMLPNRLPYKLRDLAPVLQAIPSAERDRYTKGLFLSALGETGKISEKVSESALELWGQESRGRTGNSDREKVSESALELWRQGLNMVSADAVQVKQPCNQDRQWAPRDKDRITKLEQAVQGLLLCRSLAGADTEEGE